MTQDVVLSSPPPAQSRTGRTRWRVDLVEGGSSGVGWKVSSPDVKGDIPVILTDAM